MFWQNFLLTWAPRLMREDYIPIAKKPSELNVRMALSQHSLEGVKKKADDLGVRVAAGSTKAQIITKISKPEVESTFGDMEKKREEWELRCIKILQGQAVEDSSLQASMSAVDAALSEVSAEAAWSRLSQVFPLCLLTLHAACLLQALSMRS